MKVSRNSVHFEILARLCAMPKAVRGISDAMLVRRFGDGGAIADLAKAGLIRRRGWNDGPGSVWIPTPAGEALHQHLELAPPNPACRAAETPEEDMT